MGVSSLGGNGRRLPAPADVRKLGFSALQEHHGLVDAHTLVNTVGGEGSLAYKAPRKQVHKFLGLMGFSESALRQRNGTLSGGQKARVALARCLLSGAQVLILDEPTNHLELASIQIMERALIHFPGAVVAVPHDRFFIDKVATALLVFEGNGRTRLVDGNWTTWQASLLG